MNFKISILTMIFLSSISCSTIKYENREENKDSEMLAGYLLEVIEHDWMLRTYDKIFLYDSLFALNQQLSDLVVKYDYSYDKSIISALKNLSLKKTNSIPINFQQLKSISKYKIYQMNLFNNPKTNKFDNKYLEPVKGTMPKTNKNAVVYLSLTALSDDGKYLCFVVSNIYEPSKEDSYGSIAFVMKKIDNQWKYSAQFPLYHESGGTP